MKFNIDGAERLLLVQLLARHLSEQQFAEKMPKLNSHGKNPALALFDRLQPEGSLIGTDAGDWVESKVDGKLYEAVTSPDDEYFIAIIPPATVFRQEGCAKTLDDCEYVSLHQEDVKLPSSVSIEEAVIKYELDTSNAAEKIAA